MRSNRLHFFFALILLQSFWQNYALGDYAWITDYHHLTVKLGGDFFTSSDNYGSDGIKTSLVTSNQLTTLKEYKLTPEAEYGFAKDWSMLIRVPVVAGFVDSSTDTFLSGSGLSDLNLGLKWNFLKSRSLITLEVIGKFPLYSTEAPVTDQLVLGDGTIDLSTQLHIGYRFNRNFVAGISPGFLMRTSGFENAFTVSAFGGATWNPMYVRFIVESLFSLSKPTASTVSSVNMKTGSGGSFARLSKNPDLMTVGGRVGFFFNRKYRMEAAVSSSVMGNYAPSFLRFGLNLIGDFDFYEPEPPKIKVKEVPFETEQLPIEKVPSTEPAIPAENNN